MQPPDAPRLLSDARTCIPSVAHGRHPSLRMVVGPVEQVSCASPMLSLAVADMQEPGAAQLILTAQARR